MDQEGLSQQEQANQATQALRGLENYTHVNPATSLPEVREQIFKKLAQLGESPTPQELGATLLPLYDSLKLTAGQLEEDPRKTPQMREIERMAGELRFFLQEAGYKPNLFDDDRILARLKNISPDQVRKRAQAKGQLPPLNARQGISFVYGDIASHTLQDQEHQPIHQPEPASTISRENTPNHAPASTQESSTLRPEEAQQIFQDILNYPIRDVWDARRLIGLTEDDDRRIEAINMRRGLSEEEATLAKEAIVKDVFDRTSDNLETLGEIPQEVRFKLSQALTQVINSRL